MECSTVNRHQSQTSSRSRLALSMSGNHTKADALIIGAGPTGAVAAKRLAEAGMKVVVLEQGDWPDYSKARAGHADYEITAGRDWSANPNRRQAAADYPIDDSRFRHRGCHVQRRRRQQRDFRGALAAEHALGFSRSVARRCRRRLAADV